MPPDVLLEESVSANPALVANPAAGTPSRFAPAFREPLIHFLLLGLLLYVSTRIFGKTVDPGSHNRIEITQPEIREMQSGWRTQWGRPPTDLELRDLIDRTIREEVLYREAIAAGLDRNDSIIRRRLVQKMEFLMQDPSLVGEPSDAQLIEWFRRNVARYGQAPAFDFTHVYFSRSHAGALRAASLALVSLRANGTTPATLGGIGEPFITGNDFHAVTAAKLAEQFGSAFAQALSQAPVQQWLGPLASVYGFHLVWIGRKVPGSLPAFASVRSQVLTDYMTEQMRAAEQRAYSKLLRHYRVRIESGGISK